MISKDKPCVYVPTRGRIRSQHSMESLCLKDLAESKEAYVKFVVPECEHDEFARTYRWASLATVPDSFKLGGILQYIVENLPGRFHVIVDDDMVLLRRRSRCKITQVGAAGTPRDAADMFRRILMWRDLGFAHGGFSLRQTNHFCKDAWYKTNTRVCGMHFFDTDVLSGEGIRFDALDARSDFHVILSLLERGYSNVCDYEFMVGQWTNMPGGCSLYRNPQFLLDQAKKLAALHPNSVKLVSKTSTMQQTSATKFSDGTIPDVQVGWKKSFQLRMSDRMLDESFGSLSQLPCEND